MAYYRAGDWKASVAALEKSIELRTAVTPSTGSSWRWPTGSWGTKTRPAPGTTRRRPGREEPAPARMRSCSASEPRPRPCWARSTCLRTCSRGRERPGNSSPQTKQITRGPLSARTIGVRALILSHPDPRKDLSHDSVEHASRNRGSRTPASPPASSERPAYRPAPASPLRRTRVRARSRLDGLAARTLAPSPWFPRRPRIW